MVECLHLKDLLLAHDPLTSIDYPTLTRALQQPAICLYKLWLLGNSQQIGVLLYIVFLAQFEGHHGYHVWRKDCLRVWIWRGTYNVYMAYFYICMYTVAIHCTCILTWAMEGRL